jgi:hypothetical protein
MRLNKYFLFLILVFIPFAVYPKTGVRKVSSSSCQVIRVNLGLGMTTQIVLDQEPKVTLYADQKHFKVNTTALSPRSIAIIPFIDTSEINIFKDSRGKFPPPKILAEALDKSFKTNLFVFFENNNQLMFDLRFVEKTKADYLLKVKQTFQKDCAL